MTAGGGLGADGVEELAGHRGGEPGPHVPLVPVPVDVGHPAGRDDVVRADRQQDVARGRDLGQAAELPVRLQLGGLQVRQRVQPPARAVVVRHVGGEQPVAVRRDPLELGAELHPPVAAARGPGRAPLVERPARPCRRGQPGRRHQARIARIVPERVQHPRAARIAAEHVPLEPDAVDGVADDGFGADQVGVRLVVVAADDLHPAFGHQPPQVLPVLREGVEVRLEVVDLGQHELVVGVPPGLVQVRADQLERAPDVRQAAVLVRQAEPGLGELALGVPPHRVVVEVADHPHGPARLGHGDVRFGLDPGTAPGLALEGDCDPPRAARLVGRRDLHGDLEGLLFPGVQIAYPERTRIPHSRPLHAQAGGGGSWLINHQRDPDDLQRTLRGAHEQVC